MRALLKYAERMLALFRGRVDRAYRAGLKASFKGGGGMDLLHHSALVRGEGGRAGPGKVTNLQIAEMLQNSGEVSSVSLHNLISRSFLQII